MANPKQYVRLDLSVENEVVKYLQVQPWQSVNNLIQQFAGLPVHLDDTKLKQINTKDKKEESPEPEPEPDKETEPVQKATFKRIDGT